MSCDNSYSVSASRKSPSNPAYTWADTEDILVEVKSSNDEYAEYSQVSKKLRESMPDARISRLWRIQNLDLYDNFWLQKLRLQRQGVSTQETEVWHGTNTVDPSAIYADKQDGFMMQYAREGCWGRGTYFAEKSSYSDEYASTTTLHNSDRPPMLPDEKEMFFVRLLEGRSVHFKRSDTTLVAPPFDEVTGQRFNSVTGSKKGSKIYVVYENGRAYPNYLVRYYTPKFEWQFDQQFDYGPNNGWSPYSPEQQSQLENEWKSGRTKTIIGIFDQIYDIDFVRMRQTNISHPARRSRCIQRVEVCQCIRNYGVCRGYCRGGRGGLF